MSPHRFVTMLAAAGLLAACAHEPAELPELPAASAGAPEAEGLSWLGHNAIDWILDWRVATGARSGYVALVAKGGRVVHGYAVGSADGESATPMAMDTRFRMASMTKPVTAVAAMILVEEGKLSLDDPVGRYLPAFADMRVATAADDDGNFVGVAQSPAMTLRHLLTFQSGIGGYGEGEGPAASLYEGNDLERGQEGSLAERIDRLAALPLYEQPGQRWRYGWSMDVVARIVEIASGEPFDAFLERRIFAPLGMRATSFPKGLEPGTPVATVYTQAEGGDLVPVADRGFLEANWTPGGSGLVSTAPDYMRFALMLWNRGSYDGVRFGEPETIAQMTRLQVPSGVLQGRDIEGLGFGLGVSVVADEELTPMTTRNGDFWWSGFFGTHFWVSPSTGVVLVVLQQNQQSEHSGLPLAPYLVQGVALR